MPSRWENAAEHADPERVARMIAHADAQRTELGAVLEPCRSHQGWCSLEQEDNATLTLLGVIEVQAGVIRVLSGIIARQRPPE